MRPRVRRVYAPKLRLVFLLFGIFILLLFVVKGVMVSQRFMDLTGVTPVTLARLAFDTGADLGAIDGRVNILVLGFPGGTHAGTDLTDSILVMSFHEKNLTLSMISIPRDVWSETLKDKINSAYHYGEQKKKGGGLVLAKAIVSDVVGLPIQYAGAVNFSGFKEVIDMVGGVTVEVPQTFTDSEFPIPGKEDDECEGDTTYACRYEPLHFDAGVQTMDGDRALKYVRSRHAIGNEGSDFARGRRQQEVILALKTKLLSTEMLTLSNVEKLYGAFEKATETDMNVGELLTVGKLFSKISESNTHRISLEDHLYTPPSSWYGRYVLLPKEDFPSLHTYIQSQLK
jgi:LCP family protein required for cell wall assembly